MEPSRYKSRYRQQICYRSSNPNRDRGILALWARGKTLHEIGEMVGLSRQRVCIIVHARIADMDPTIWKDTTPARRAEAEDMCPGITLKFGGVPA